MFHVKQWNVFNFKMPRVDRSFTSDDLLRFYCRNLSPWEQVVARAQIAFGFCDGDFCIWSKRVLSIMNGICAIFESPAGRLLTKIPLIGTTAAAVLTFLCSATGLLDMAYKINCQREEVISAAQDTITNVRRALLEFTKQGQASEIANRIREAQAIDQEAVDAIRQEVIDQLFYSTENITIMQ